MPTDALPPAAPPATTGGPASNWELAHQWQRAWRGLKWTFTAVTIIGFLVVIGQGYLFFGMFAAIHPALGWAFVVILTALLLLLVGRPLVSFFTTPVVAEPSDAILDPIAPTSRAQRPPALTTCSACTVPLSVTTSQVPSGRCFVSRTMQCVSIVAPPILAALA